MVYTSVFIGNTVFLQRSPRLREQLECRRNGPGYGGQRHEMRFSENQGNTLLYAGIGSPIGGWEEK
jgi:hypothetical protein